MPIPFRDAEDIAEFGVAAFLKIETQPPAAYRGALFLINARGEPIEFTYNRVETPNSFLWRREDIRRHAVRQLVTSMLGACSRRPALVCCLAEEVPFEVFCVDITLSVPVCRLATLEATTTHSPAESSEETSSGSQQAFWFPSAPSDGSKERQLFQRLASSGFLNEPFERALVGLREVYGTPAQPKAT